MESLYCLPSSACNEGHTLPANRCKAAHKYWVFSWEGPREMRRYQGTGQIIRIPTVDTSWPALGYMVSVVAAPSHQPLGLSPHPPACPGSAPGRTTSKNKHPHLGIPWDLEGVCGCLDYSWVESYRPSLSPPTHNHSLEILYSLSIWELIIPHSPAWQLLHQLYPLKTSN